MGWLFGGYFGGWYLLFGAGYVFWLSDPLHRESWGSVVFGAFAYFVFIPCLLFSLMKLLEKLDARAESVVQDGLARRAVGRGYVFAVGFGGSLMAMVTCAVLWMVAGVSQDLLTEEKLGETGLTIAMVSLMFATCAIATGCLWLGMRHLLTKCRLREPGERPTWSERFVPVAVLLVWAATIGWLGYRVANATVVITATLDFAALPATDEPLEARLRSEPGIAAAVVRRQGNVVVVECALPAHRSHGFLQIWKVVTIEHTMSGGERRSFPLSAVAAELGYQDLRKAEFGRPRTEW